MAEIRSRGILHHLRAEPTAHILRYRRGHLVASGTGLSFWFYPLTTALAEVPIDDRERPFLFQGRTIDFQDVSAQGTLTYHVADPEVLAKRIDFSIDLRHGHYQHEPLEQLAAIVLQFAEAITLEYLSQCSLQQALQEGIAKLRSQIKDGLHSSHELSDLGIQLVAVRLAHISPTAEMEKALQAPAREAVQQQADQAAFERRALAVEKERAIAENEMQNKIELARREETLIEQHGQNERRRVIDEVETRKLEAEASAERIHIHAAAEADNITQLEKARNAAESRRIDIYRDLSGAVLMGLAAREIAGKLERIEHLNLSPDALRGLR
jgi:regulator of protease activity HflC (stomatin/prohibitin superfamily)